MSTTYEKFQHLRIVSRAEIMNHFSGDVEKANNAIRWLIKSGKAQPIKTGLYYLKRPDEWFEKEVTVSPWLVASKAMPNGVVAYHSALRLRGEAYSETSQFQVAVGLEFPRAPKSFAYQGASYHFSRADISFGIEEVPVLDFIVRAFSKERLLLEGLMAPDKFFGMAEFLKSIEGFKWIDLDSLLAMLPHYPLATISMRLGWLLEKFRDKWYVGDVILEKLRQNKPQDLAFLEARKRKGNVLERKWNLMVPATLAFLDE